MSAPNAWWQELEGALINEEDTTCLYHGLYGRDGVMATQVVKEKLPVLREIIKCESDGDFRLFIIRCFTLSEKGGGSLALLLRSLVAWRKWGVLEDDANREWHHVNNTYLEGGLPHPEEFCENDEESMKYLMDEMSEAWHDDQESCELWVGINTTFGIFANPTKLWHYCEMRDAHDLYTTQYIEKLSGMLIDIPGTFLEVGCGRGYLSKYLNEAFKGAKKVIPTDLDLFPGVVAQSYEAALKAYTPSLVICAWMPYGADWTPDFRSTLSVTHYLLIGPITVSASPEAWIPKDGWTGARLVEADEHSICKLDCEQDPGNTKTILYKRS